MSFAAPASLTERIADHLGADIIAGRLPPGARIQEMKVASDLGVSRGSVREGLLMLERRHLIRLLPRRGAVVSALEASAVRECAELLGELLTLLYTKVARRNVVEPQCQALERELRLMESATRAGDVEGVLNARRRFVALASTAVDSPHLVAIVGGLMPAGLRIAHLAAGHPEHDLRDSTRLHQALIEAIKVRDTNRLRELLTAFLARESRLARAVLGDASA